MSAIAPLPASRASAQEFGLGRVLQLVFGALGILATLAFLAAGSRLSWALVTQRDAEGYFTTSTHRFETSSYALASDDLGVSTQWPDRALGYGVETVRITATSADRAKAIFVGIARTDDVDRYLARVEHDRITDLATASSAARYERSNGGAPSDPPVGRRFWRAQASGGDTLTIVWPLEEGRWTMVAMNADGSRAVSIDTELGARVPRLGWLVAGLLALGVLSLLGGATLVYFGARTRAPFAKEA